MTEHGRAELIDVEEMVRAAGGYLEVSDDLRPRTLEEARDDRRESSTRCRMAILAAALITLAVFTDQFCNRIASPLKGVVSTDDDRLFTAAQQQAARSGADPSWSLVDAFRGLRQRQGRLIGDAFWYLHRNPG